MEINYKRLIFGFFIVFIGIIAVGIGIWITNSYLGGLGFGAISVVEVAKRS